MMLFRYLHRALRRIASYAIDWTVSWRLGITSLDRPSKVALKSVDTNQYWSNTRVHSPFPVTRLFNGRKTFNGKAITFDIEGISEGPGYHPGSKKFMASIFRPVTLPDTPMPFVILLHGFAVPVPYLEEWHARKLVEQGAVVARLELPFHMRRRIVGTLSGDGFFALDPERTVESIRQSVEDAAAIIAWARTAFHIDHVSAMGFSLGGLVTTLIATQLELDAAVAVAPFCDPVHTFLEKLPRNAKRRVGLVGTSGGVWGMTMGEAEVLLRRVLSPIIPENHMEIATPPHRICLVAPYYDNIVGFEPIVRLASSWGTELISQPFGHMNIMTANKLAPLYHAWLLEDHDSPEQIRKRGRTRHIQGKASQDVAIHTIGRREGA